MNTLAVTVEILKAPKFPDIIIVICDMRHVSFTCPMVEVECIYNLPLELTVSLRNCTV